MAQQKQDFQRQPRRKYCQFCKEETEYIDYKDVQLLRKYMTDRGKIKPRRVTGACTQHQHDIANAIKRAREMALLPYAVPVVSSRGNRNREERFLRRRHGRRRAPGQQRQDQARRQKGQDANFHTQPSAGGHTITAA